MRQYRPTSASTSKTGDDLVALQALLHRHERIDPHAIVVDVEKSITPREPNPGSTTGATRGDHHGGRSDAPSAATGRDVEPGGPAGCRPHRAPIPARGGVRRRTAAPWPPRGRATRRAGGRRPRAPSPRSPTSATGGSSASSGLPARNASECAANTAAHTPARPASISGASGGDGATCTRACSPTQAGGVEHGPQRLGGRQRRTRSSRGTPARPIAIARPAALASVASTGSAARARVAITAEATPPTSSRSVGAVALEDAPERDRRGGGDRARSRRRRSDAVRERTFPGCVPSFLQWGRGCQHDAVPARASEGEVRPGSPGPRAGQRGPGAGWQGRRGARARRASDRTRPPPGSAT